MKRKNGVAYGEASWQQMDIYMPDEKATSAFVYFHGGGLVKGDKSSAEKFASFLCERGVILISANYCLLGTTHFPDFIFDAAKAVMASYEYIRSMGIDEIYVGGSSAGAYLSMMLCFDKRYLESVGIDPLAIKGYFHAAGQPTAHYNILKDRGIDSRRVIIDETAPLYFVGLEKSYPPMRFVVSDEDMKGRYEQTMLILSALSHFGYEKIDHVVMPGEHCEYCKTFDENGDSVFGKMIYDFIKNVK